MLNFLFSNYVLCRQLLNITVISALPSIYVNSVGILLYQFAV